MERKPPNQRSLGLPGLDEILSAAKGVYTRPLNQEPVFPKHRFRRKVEKMTSKRVTESGTTVVHEVGSPATHTLSVDARKARRLRNRARRLRRSQGLLSAQRGREMGLARAKAKVKESRG